MQVMNRIYGTHHDVRSPLRKQMSSLSASFVERKADVIKMRNDDLMSFHAIGASLREFVEALLVRAVLHSEPALFVTAFAMCAGGGLYCVGRGCGVGQYAV